MKIFWSWQNDFGPKTNRQFIRNALAEAVKNADEELCLEDAERPNLAGWKPSASHCATFRA